MYIIGSELQKLSNFNAFIETSRPKYFLYCPHGGATLLHADIKSFTLIAYSRQVGNIHQVKP